jgi:hypothetical protein
MSDYLSMSLEINRLNEVIADLDSRLDCSIRSNEYADNCIESMENLILEKDKDIERLHKTLSEISRIRLAKIRSLEDIISELDCDL